MAKFCTQCGSQVDETAKFCKKCGAKLAPMQSTEYGAPTATQSPGYSAPTVNQPTSNYQSTPTSTFGQPPYQEPYQQVYQGPAPQADLKPNVAGMLCYPLAFITGFIFLTLSPYNKDRFVRFHAWQSIFFSLALVVFSFAVRILPSPLDWILLFALRLLALGGIGWLMYKAYQNEWFKLPVVGDLADKQASNDTTR